MRFSLPSGRRAKSALLATLATASVACAPSIAHAQVFSESWEPNVSTKWVASSTVNTYNETGTVSPIRNSVVDDGPAAACAGRYAREVTGTSGGRMFTKPGLAIKNNTDYCLMAYIRRNAAGAPYLGINFEPSGTTPGVGSSTDNECWLIGEAAFNNTFTTGFYCPPGVATIGNNPETGAVPTANRTAWTFVKRQFRTPAAGMPGNFAYIKYEHFCGSASCGGAQTAEPNGPDFDDIRLIEGTCPAAAPVDMPPHVPCAGNTPVCTVGGAADNAKCMDCNGNNGDAAATRPCPTAGAAICVTAGADKGSCKPPCSGDFNSGGAAACTETAPFCRPAGQPTATCKACNGDAGSGATEACGSTVPTCFSAGAKAGACGKCTSNADCSAAKPRCDIPTGACSDDCTKDDDCGGKTSGKVCNANKCADGCRGDLAAGNGCPTGKKCTSIGATIGQCVDNVPTAKDSDNDGLTDDEETKLGLNPNLADTDGDGLFDGAEVGPDKTKPLDTDGDGKIDANDTDDDNDGLLTKDEISAARAANLTDDVDGDGKKNWLDNDADADGVLDGQDGIADTNGNGKPDFLDNTAPAGGVPGQNGPFDPNFDGELEGGGCTVSPTSGANGATALFGMALGFAALARARRRRN